MPVVKSPEELNGIGTACHSQSHADRHYRWLFLGVSKTSSLASETGPKRFSRLLKIVFKPIMQTFELRIDIISIDVSHPISQQQPVLQISDFVSYLSVLTV